MAHPLIIKNLESMIFRGTLTASVLDDMIIPLIGKLQAGDNPVAAAKAQQIIAAHSQVTQALTALREAQALVATL